MRVGRKIALVGGVPILVAAAIAAAGWFLLAQGERARAGALLAARVYHDLTLARSVRDDFVAARADARAAIEKRFFDLTDKAGSGLETLQKQARSRGQAERAAAARQSLDRYVARMRDFSAVARENDGLIAEMGQRAGRLTDLAEQARRRQQASNVDLAWTLTGKVNRLRATRDAVTGLNAVLAGAWQLALARERGGSPEAGRAERTRLVHAGRDLAAALRATSRETEAAEAERLTAADTSLDAGDRLTEWGERLLKIVTSEQRTLDDEVAQLLAYAGEANATEQATQNIGITTLKLGQRTAEALTRRDAEAASAMLGEGERLSASASALPISPLIQSEMIEAIDGWRARLATTVDGLTRQNAMIAEMDGLAAGLSEAARALNDDAVEEADRFGTFLGQLLLAGAAAGLLLGALVALAVARSILVPLRQLQGDMIALAADPKAEGLSGTQRTDELGDIARATNFFVTEIGRRERALRRAKDQADHALHDLHQAQDDLIRAEKLASLGQLVAGVAHEINTPLGIALTTATLVRDETRAFQGLVAAGTLSRSRLTHFVDRVGEGTQLLCANLTRAADLVHGFKQVAVDRASDERRRFDLDVWLGELLASLQPMLRKGGHRIERDAPSGIVVDTYPGVLAQVVTNLVANAVVHGFAGGERPGTITVRASGTGPLVRLEVSDDGSGIAPEHLGRIFDPFFTTARSHGSTGLGMHIVHNLVTARLQGRIAVESEPGRGTLVRLEFPRAPGDAERPGAARRPAGAQAS
ncbi:HAMP domain-containing sensor histidine kinase [Methylorubrum rhodesianum]|uniref:histidine kinase n=2 Tax=Pseudomonadota TaxID=1224 RepID=A0ABU9ZBA6_9HYPH|nr:MULTISPECIES: HAMP domain-containing sensor histidine kinase [Methylorubrum]MBI1690852.1 sensor histidine kinase [Methylorubrum sp. DB1722]MBK3401460.1 HAMP domain-containing histidine kinase [Methylorubrum rhodesianum]MBY0142082.1 HAMP domain-containing histidine kinase [Methylorubrum populi]